MEGCGCEPVSQPPQFLTLEDFKLFHPTKGIPAGSTKQEVPTARLKDILASATVLAWRQPCSLSMSQCLSHRFLLLPRLRVPAKRFLTRDMRTRPWGDRPGPLPQSGAEVETGSEIRGNAGKIWNGGHYSPLIFFLLPRLLFEPHLFSPSP